MDHITQLAKEFVVLGRTHALFHSQSTAWSWRSIAELVLRGRSMEDAESSFGEPIMTR
eukprot:CAMPEP_0194440174 /NCGR_PEP_ID=MMETSP0176-20130528/114457_1 /TAXON_ID=216777 /ORGANISM="Proboscia alata, Strain PI-D3" /LENGTH=57 /DNA_ID=CAMNT_0039264147 /DNA_START=212 /DNA_END=382 /DNA_ORIENTATION=-